LIRLKYVNIFRWE